MKIILIALLLFSVFMMRTHGQGSPTFNKLTPEEERVILRKGTEAPGTGKLTAHKEKGTYICKRCNAPLFLSEDKFDSHCGWPSYDDEIPGAVKRLPDADGMRTEIVCAKCGGHLGHVFLGEGFTPKNTRHCVNSISLNYLPGDKEKKPYLLKNSREMWRAPSARPQGMRDAKYGRKILRPSCIPKGGDVQQGACPPLLKSVKKPEKAYFAGGCFWGVEYYFKQKPGVLNTSVGFIGGTLKKPTYKDVCRGDTGHAEAIEVEYDPAVISFEALAKLFFEIHDPTQENRQGPDIGGQYRSEVFFTTPEQKETAENLIKLLKGKKFDVKTKVTKADQYWRAEDYHQDYYREKGNSPTCHFPVKRFDN